MIKKMKLKGTVKKQDEILIFSSNHYDGTPFSIKTTNSDIHLKEPFNDELEFVECVLHVVLEGQQDSRCYITLPQPSISCGKHVTVNRGQLLIHNAPYGI
jgi:hypothetical protein